jgi:hypothetical protein
MYTYLISNDFLYLVPDLFNKNWTIDTINIHVE